MRTALSHPACGTTADAPCRHRPISACSSPPGVRQADLPRPVASGHARSLCVCRIRDPARRHTTAQPAVPLPDHLARKTTSPRHRSRETTASFQAAVPRGAGSSAFPPFQSPARQAARARRHSAAHYAAVRQAPGRACRRTDAGSRTKMTACPSSSDAACPGLPSR